MIRFRRLSHDDLALLHKWINEDPLINQVWSDGKALSVADLEQKYGPRIAGDQPTDPYLVLDHDTPIGYIQTYLWRDYPGYDQYVDLENAASLDVFIGEAAYRNRGLGVELLSGFLRDYVFSRPEVVSCVITPVVGNTGAIRVYEKVGFKHVATVPDIPGEPGPVYFMRIDRER